MMQKLDQEELQSVCKVMEDLIRMHMSIFTVSPFTIVVYVSPNSWCDGLYQQYYCVHCVSAAGGLQGQIISICVTHTRT